MPEFDLSLAAIALTVLLIGLFAEVVRKDVGGGPLVALVIGFLLGPAAGNLIDPAGWTDRGMLIEQLARLTVALGLMEIGLSLRGPLGRPLQRSLALRLMVVLPLMWAISTVLLQSILGLPFVLALLIGAAVAPTDPILASSIVTGDMARKSMGRDFRDSLSLESAANDGISWAFVMLPVLMISRPTDNPFRHWLLDTIAMEVVGGLIFGVIFGIAFGFLMRWVEGMKEFPESAFNILAIFLALTIVSISRLFGGDGLLSVFVAALIFDRVAHTEEKEERDMSRAVNRFFIIPVFVVFGALLPVDRWLELGWAGIGVTVAILLFRRVPVMLLIMRLSPIVKRLPENLMAGWFGPIGVAALFYAAVAERRTHDDTIWVVVTLIVTGSIVVHGLTAPILVRLYQRAYPGRGEGE